MQSPCAAAATLVYGSVNNTGGEYENGTQHYVDCVAAVCTRSGTRTEDIYGASAASVKRALATPTASCTCGASFHTEEGNIRKTYAKGTGKGMGGGRVQRPHARFGEVAKSRFIKRHLRAE